MKSTLKNKKGITLITLVITIVVMIILAAVAVNMTIGDNGIFTKAKEAKKTQLIAEAKEKIGTEILSAQMDATERNEELEQTQIEDIVSKYGVLQEDGDTIVLNDNGYEVSLKDIYSGTTTTGGSYSELKAQVALLKQQLADSNLSGSEASQQLSELRTTLSGTTVTEDKILKDYKAYKDGALITGTMINNAGKTVVASNKDSDSTNIYLTIPEAGYYDNNSKISATNSESTQVYYLGTGTSFNIKTKCTENGIDYTKLTSNNFIVCLNTYSVNDNVWIKSGGVITAGSKSNSGNPNKAYNATDGTLTVSVPSISANACSYYDCASTATASIAFSVYLVSGTIK